MYRSTNFVCGAIVLSLLGSACSSLEETDELGMEENASVDGVSAPSGAEQSLGVAVNDASAPTATRISVGTGTTDVTPNRSGEHCVNVVSTRVKLFGVTDPDGVRGVRFMVIGASNGGAGSAWIPLTGVKDASGTWYATLRFSSLPVHDVYTVKAFPIDNLGNSREATDLNNPDYPYTVEVKHDTTLPTVYMGSDQAQTGASYYMNGDDAITNTDRLRIYNTVFDAGPGAAGPKIVNAYVYANGTTIANLSLIPTSTDNRGNGLYESTIDVSRFANTETRLRVRYHTEDFAGNRVLADRYVTIDKLSPRGTVSMVAPDPNSRTAVAEFVVSPDASGLRSAPEFYIWTTPGANNGQDDMEMRYGELVPGTTDRYRVTFDRATHNNEAGEYNVHVWTWDTMNNHNFASYTTIWMN